MLCFTAETRLLAHAAGTSTTAACGATAAELQPSCSTAAMGQPQKKALALVFWSRALAVNAGAWL